jgi:hypothetical protein
MGCLVHVAFPSTRGPLAFKRRIADQAIVGDELRGEGVALAGRMGPGEFASNAEGNLVVGIAADQAAR